VLFALPDRTLLLKRPPKNRLPLVDFSYRPLFMCLSIDNVLTLFGCLLTEAKVSTCLVFTLVSLLNQTALIECSCVLHVSYKHHIYYSSVSALHGWWHQCIDIDAFALITYHS
jgi:DENN (AEX-3) domain